MDLLLVGSAVKSGRASPERALCAAAGILGLAAIDAKAAPKIVLYSAYADASLVIPSMLAGADGVVNKGAPANELYDAIRTVARGDRVVPPLSRELLDDANTRLHQDDLPILGMALDGTPEAEIARTLGLSTEEMTRRMDRMISTLKVEIPVSRGG